jgi:hypothetical protein
VVRRSGLGDQFRESERRASDCRAVIHQLDTSFTSPYSLRTLAAEDRESAMKNFGDKVLKCSSCGGTLYRGTHTRTTSCPCGRYQAKYNNYGNGAKDVRVYDRGSLSKVHTISESSEVREEKNKERDEAMFMWWWSNEVRKQRSD